jgi:hypothetical protein
MTGAHGGVEESFHNSFVSAKLLKKTIKQQTTQKTFSD